MQNKGTRRFALAMMRREPRRTAAVFSLSGPTMNPGVSHSEITGRL